MCQLYRGYENNEWFKYKDEIFIEANFNISTEKNENITTHIHRPIETYIKTLIKCGFVIENLDELTPSQELEDKFPKNIPYPRFLAITTKK